VGEEAPEGVVERGVPLEPESAQGIGEYAAQQWELEL